MARSFFRNVTDQITGGSGKTTDIQIVQAVNRFEDEHSKILKFRREFDKYTQAILVFDNASFRFFDSIRSLADASWTQQQILDQSCIDIGRIRTEHLQHLHKQINSNFSSLFNTFDLMKVRIDEQYHIQHDYDKTRKQYQASMRRDEQAKVDRIKNDLEQLKSALNLVNGELRRDLEKFHVNVQNQELKIIIELFDIHRNFYKNFHKECSIFVERLQKNPSTDLDKNDNAFQTPPSSSSMDIDKEKLDSIPFSDIKRTDYKILHQARVIHDYEAENDDELDLVKDEYISVISFFNEEYNERDEGWEFAEKSDGTIGLFPVNFAIRLYENEEKL